MNSWKKKQNKGFTLIELIVVISLFSMMLFFSIPRFHNAVLSDNTRKVSQWIIGKSEFLKERSVRDQELYILHVSMDFNRLWITKESMSEEQIHNAQLKGFELPGEVAILDVEYPDKEKVSVGRADICFYKKGYSDMALIHIEDNSNKQLSFLIEPFLSRIKVFEEYVGFEK